MLASALLACGRATAAPAPAKWVGPWIATPNGGQRQTAIYYGPWQCTARWLQDCSAKCAREGHQSMGCIWIADIKYDWQGAVGPLPAAAGGRLAITHCCCDWPTAPPTSTQKARAEWSRGREKFREQWSNEVAGEWPNGPDRFWDGHHIRDLLHGGDPLDPDNVLPVPPEVHGILGKEYLACYAGGGRWAQPGHERPYAE